MRRRRRRRPSRFAAATRAGRRASLRRPPRALCGGPPQPCSRWRRGAPRAARARPARHLGGADERGDGPRPRPRRRSLRRASSARSVPLHTQCAFGPTESAPRSRASSDAARLVAPSASASSVSAARPWKPRRPSPAATRAARQRRRGERGGLAQRRSAHRSLRRPPLRVRIPHPPPRTCSPSACRAVLGERSHAASRGDLESMIGRARESLSADGCASRRARSSQPYERLQAACEDVRLAGRPARQRRQRRRRPLGRVNAADTPVVGVGPASDEPSNRALLGDAAAHVAVRACSP